MRRTSLLLLFTFSLFNIPLNSVEAQFGLGNAGGNAGGNGQQGNQGAGNERGVGNRDGGSSAAGGGSAADFDSLMALIETTVSPETWEALGGPSSMFPYPQGVYVDASGTLKEIEWPTDTDSTNKLKSILVRPPAAGPTEFGDWKEPSSMRFVSLRRLLNENKFSQTETAETIDCLAGLSQIRYVFLEQDDIILAGPVGGIELHEGWYRDQKSGRTALRSDFFITALASALANEPFGCTIDPTRKGLRHAAHIAAMVKSNNIPIGAAPEEMVIALGMQQIEVFGTAGDSPIGYVMVEADRHMKQLALGVHPMPEGTRNYLDIVEQTIDQGPPQDLLLRLWFTAKPRGVRAGPDRDAFEIAGTPIRLSGQNERAVANGTRGHVTKDPGTNLFVDEFNQHWSDIRREYPIYSALESIYQAASIAELLGRTAISPQQQELLTSLAAVDTTSRFIMPTPRQVESIAVLHTFRNKRRRHHILVASGGVAVSPEQTLPSSFIGYPSLQKRSPSASEPAVSKRWWWDR